ncbi:MAG: hypothetical protein JWN77_2629 [Frankiales bacterium]|nr:hypothetical protein [Frankiales bacterium]
MTLPDLAIFGRGRTRRAVVRGLLRTALLALVLWVAFGLIGSIVGFAAFSISGRDDTFERVGVVGLNVAHPSIDRGRQSFGAQTFGWLRTTKTDKYVQPDGSFVQTDVRMDLLGRISVKSPPGSRLDQALFEGRASPEQAARFVRDLPASAVADVVVDFKTPLSNNAYTALMRDPRIAKMILGEVTYYEDPFAGPRRLYRRDGGSEFSGSSAVAERSVAWGGMNYPFSSFAAWTRALKKSDDGNLSRLGLPSSAELKKLGEASLIHGVYIKNATPSDLNVLLGNASVRSITPVDVRFTILNRDQSR